MLLFKGLKQSFESWQILKWGLTYYWFKVPGVPLKGFPEGKILIINTKNKLNAIDCHKILRRF